jgi:hypothetical protein
MSRTGATEPIIIVVVDARCRWCTYAVEKQRIWYDDCWCPVVVVRSVSCRPRAGSGKRATRTSTHLANHDWCPSKLVNDTAQQQGLAAVPASHTGRSQPKTTRSQARSCWSCRAECVVLWGCGVIAAGMRDCGSLLWCALWSSLLLAALLVRRC